MSWASAGQSGFKGSRKSTPFAAQVAAEQAARKAQDNGMRTVGIYVKGCLLYTSRKAETRESRAQHGLRRTLLANCIEGVTKGFSKTLEAVSYTHLRA